MSTPPFPTIHPHKHTSFSKTISEIAFLCFLSCLSTSCVPLFIGGAIGYIAREEGIGKIEPANGQDRTYYYSTTPPDQQESSDDYPTY